MLPSSESSATDIPSSLSRRCSSSVRLRYLLIATDLSPTHMGGHLYRTGNLVQYTSVQLLFKLYVATVARNYHDQCCDQDARRRVAFDPPTGVRSGPPPSGTHWFHLAS